MRFTTYLSIFSDIQVRGEDTPKLPIEIFALKQKKGTCYLVNIQGLSFSYYAICKSRENTTLFFLSSFMYYTFFDIEFVAFYFELRRVIVDILDLYSDLLFHKISLVVGNCDVDHVFKAGREPIGQEQIPGNRIDLKKNRKIKISELILSAYW